MAAKILETKLNDLIMVSHAICTSLYRGCTRLTPSCIRCAEKLRNCLQVQLKLQQRKCAKALGKVHSRSSIVSVFI
jgi:hypothetical protein